MDIVKQRRKRLMAWILAIVLCVSMWQGSVYATEGMDDGSGTISGNDVGNSEEIVTPEVIVSDEAIPQTENAEIMLAADTGGADQTPEEDPVPEDPITEVKTEYNVNISLAYQSQNGVGTVRETPSSTGSFGSHTLTWGPNASGEVMITLENTNPTAITGGAFKGASGISHPLLGWYDKSGDIGRLVTGNTLNIIDNKFNISDSQYNKGEGVTDDNVIIDTQIITYDVYAVLGKSVNVNYLEKGAEGLVSTKTKTCIQNADGALWTVEAPVSAYSEDGLFFVNWATANSGGAVYPSGANNGYDDFDFESELDLYAQYTNVITEAKSYQLKANTEYHLLGGNTWSIGDGYTYSGDQNFCVKTNGTYPFQAQSKAE